MALVSPGVQVTITDESFFIPAAASTVPLIFVATAAEKLQPDGVSDAEGTFEFDVVRTVTSLEQSVQLYGVPKFLEDSNGSQFHGDSRNEYGVFALNSFLGIGNRAYVVRTNVNLNDDITDLRALWDNKISTAETLMENLTAQFIFDFNLANQLTSGDPGFKQTITATEYTSLSADALEDLFDFYSFVNTETDFNTDHSTATGSPLIAGLDVFANGYDQPPTSSYEGLQGMVNDWVTLGMGTVVVGEFTPQEAADLIGNSGDEYKFTISFKNNTSLGANDAAKRVAIVTAFQASVNSNTEIRSENFDYNLVLCPGYPEVVDELLALVVDIQQEALVIADTPVDEDPDGITNPSTGWAATTARQRSVNVAYYYPWGLASNLDGVNVVVAPSGIALRTYAFSDNVSFLWFAPAGTRRGIITGISNLGYVTGTLGTPTTFVETNLNQGQRDALYQYAPSGDINPLVFFPGDGFVVWGQKTSAPDASAMDRVNVSRLMKYIKRQLRRNTLSFVFEPNDQLTRDNLKSVVDGFLGQLVVKRGLFDFATISDESNNTPTRIDRNELWCDIAVKPIRAAEFIFIPIRIVATGAEI